MTGEQGYVDDERSCFWTWDNTGCAWQFRPYKGSQVKKKKREKEKAKDDPKGPEKHSLVMSKRKIPNRGNEKAKFGGPKARMACQKAMMASIKVVFALTSPKKSRQEGYGRARESDDSSASHGTDDSWTPDAGWFCTKAHTAWMVATPLNLAIHPTHVVLDFAHSRLDQKRQPKNSRSMHGIMALRRNSAVAISVSCLPTPRQKPARRVALSTFQQQHHVLQKLMCLRQVMCPSCFPSLR